MAGQTIPISAAISIIGIHSDNGYSVESFSQRLSVDILDNNGRLLPGAIITAESGTTYASALAAPEPGGIAVSVFTFAFLGLIFALRSPSQPH